jgi:hypothetical protein
MSTPWYVEPRRRRSPSPASDVSCSRGWSSATHPPSTRGSSSSAAACSARPRRRSTKLRSTAWRRGRRPQPSGLQRASWSSTPTTRTSRSCSSAATPRPVIRRRRTGRSRPAWSSFGRSTGGPPVPPSFAPRRPGRRRPFPVLEPAESRPFVRDWRRGARRSTRAASIRAFARSRAQQPGRRRAARTSSRRSPGSPSARRWSTRPAVATRRVRTR